MDELIFGRKTVVSSGSTCLLSNHEQKILALIDGKRNVAEAVRLSGMKPGVVHHSLGVLYSLGLIEKYNPESGEATISALEMRNFIVGSYCAVLFLVNDLLVEELGDASRIFLEECKLSLPRDQRSFVGVFDPLATLEENITSISNRIERGVDSSLVHEFLRDGFEEFCRRIFFDAAIKLDGKVVERILERFKKRLSSVANDNGSNPLIIMINQSMDRIVADVMEELKFHASADNQNNGFFEITAVN